MAAAMHGFSLAARLLTVLNLVFYTVLVTMTLVRLLLWPSRFAADLLDHKRGPGFFTTVAATSVLGRQLLVIQHRSMAATLLFYVTVPLWVIFMYAVFAGLTTKKEKPSLEEGIHGGWLIAVVASQAVSVLGSALVPYFPGREPTLLFFCLTLWLCGGMLYIWMISLIFYRYTFFRFQPSDLMPPYWINMGAMAISALAGTALVENAAKARFLLEVLPFLKGFTLFFWATATWWIPMLAILAVWRHVIWHFKLHYDPLYWGAVFPLGMYSVATYRLSGVADVRFLFPLSRFFLYIALIAWLAAFAGMLRSFRLTRNAAFATMEIVETPERA